MDIYRNLTTLRLKRCIARLRRVRGEFRIATNGDWLHHATGVYGRLRARPDDYGKLF